MAASAILVDSSYYIGLLREGRDPLRTLELAAATRDLAVCGLIRCEVGRGLRQTKVLHRFQAFWDLMVDVPSDPALWNSALELAWRLDRRGIVLPLSDVIIASAAIRIGAVILNRDSHFARIPGLHVCEEAPASLNPTLLNRHG